MLAQRSQSSYAARNVEIQKAKDAAHPSPDRLLTDRSSYIAYLESQLERVSAACLTVQSFDERLEAAVSGIRVLEEKVLNLARLVSCAQQFAEAQETAGREAAAEAARRLRSVEARLEALEAEGPGREAAWEAKLRAVTAQADAKLAQVEATAEARLAEVAAQLRGGLEEACHSTHVALEKRVGEAAGKLADVERRVRGLDEYTHANDTGAAVADLSSRVSSVESSVAHLAKSDSGMKASLGSLQQAMGQLKTALVALELRPPLGEVAQSGEGCLQWVERAREALQREVADIQQQHGQLAAGLASAAAAAAAAPTSPQKALAAQVLTGLQGSMQQEVGRELQALQLADSLLGSVAQQFHGSPPRPAITGGDHVPAATAEQAAVKGAGEAGSEAAGCVASDAVASKAAAASSQASAGGTATGEWAIAAVPAGSSGPDYPPAPSSQQAVAAAAGSALAQLNQLVGSKTDLRQAAGSGSGSGSLRQTFGQMQQMLQSVCRLLQQDGGEEERRAEPGHCAPTTAFLSRSNTLRSLPSGAEGQPKRAWVPSGSNKAAVAAAAGAGPAGGALSLRPGITGAALAAGCSRSLSFQPGARGGGGGGSREALRESVLGQAALAERRRRLQELYAELRQA